MSRTLMWCLVGLCLTACEPMEPQGESPNPPAAPPPAEPDPAPGFEPFEPEPAVDPDPDDPGFDELVPSYPALEGSVDSGPCQQACADAGGLTGSARCYACQCKDAMDGWLPSVEELQCGAADEVLVYDRSGENLVEHDEGGCANPSLFSQDCPTAGRFGELREGAAVVRWLCRTTEFQTAPQGTYDYAGIIAHNTRTGATCFWDAFPWSINDTNLPDLDVSEAEDNDPTMAAFTQKIGTLDGIGCVFCHDADPFIYTPYLASTGWEPTGNEHGPYGLVQLNGSLQETFTRELREPEVEPCTACHRIGDGLGCSTFALDAVGESKFAAYDEESLSFPYSVWMPHGATGYDEATWEAEFGEARDKLLECCGDGFASESCNWEPIQPTRE